MNKSNDITREEYVSVLAKLLGCQKANMLVTPEIIENQTIIKQKIGKSGAEQLLKDLEAEGLIVWSVGTISNMETKKVTSPGFYTTQLFENLTDL